MNRINNSLWLACATGWILELCYCVRHVIFIYVQWIKSCISNIIILVFLPHEHANVHLWHECAYLPAYHNFSSLCFLLTHPSTSVSLHRLFPMKGILLFLSLAKSVFCSFMILVKAFFFFLFLKVLSRKCHSLNYYWLQWCCSESRLLANVTLEL